MEPSQLDLEELRHATWKAQATTAPHTRVMVLVEASTLLWLLEEAKVTARVAREAAASYDAETEQTIQELEEENQKLRDQLVENGTTHP